MREEQERNILTKEQLNKSQDLIENWIIDLENKNINFNKYYSDRINYYKFGNVNLSNVINDKTVFFDKWDKIELKNRTIWFR